MQEMHIVLIEKESESEKVMEKLAGYVEHIIYRNTVDFDE